MSGAITDLLDRVTDSTTGRPVISSLASPGKALAATSINISDATNWTTATAIHFSIYETTTIGGMTVKDPDTQTDWKGVLAGATISNLTLTGGGDRTYTAGAIVELTPTARYAKDLYEVISAHTNQDGSLKSQAVRDALALGATTADGWEVLPYTLSVTSGYNKGQRECDLTIASADATGVLWPGMRLRVTRGTTAPTQCADLESGSSQYASRASGSVTGISFTDDFTVEGEIDMESYTGTNSGILSRFDGTNGWVMLFDGAGRLQIFGSNGTSRGFQTVNALLPGRKYHVAAYLDMSGGAATIWVDGVVVPSVTYAGAGTALTQAGPLQIGALNSSSFFDGKLSEIRLWNGARTTTQIRDNMNQQLVGDAATLATNYPNLVGYWKLNGDFNDSTTNANHLTAQGGATATTLDNPYKNIEYAIVQKVTYSAPNTIVTVFTGQSNNIPNMTLTTPYYSKDAAPYGFPIDRLNWSVDFIVAADLPQTTPTQNQWYNIFGAVLVVPTGKWELGFQSYMEASYVSASTSFLSVFTTLALAAAAQTSNRYTCKVAGQNTALVTASFNRTLPDRIDQSSATPWYLNHKTDVTSVVQLNLQGSASPTIIRAINAYV